MQSKATTVESYLKSLPADRREALQRVREVIIQNLDPEMEEGMQYGMIGYYVPHRVYPAGYHCDPKQPLPYAALGSQKNHMSLHLCPLYGHSESLDWFQREWAKTGKKLDMGKACIRFKKVEDLPLDVIGATFQRITARKYIEQYERALNAPREGRPGASKPKPPRAQVQSRASADALKAGRPDTLIRQA